MASEFLHVFFLLMILAGKSWIQPLLNKGEIPERTRSRLVRNLVAEVEFGHEERALWSEKLSPPESEPTLSVRTSTGHKMGLFGEQNRPE